MAKNKSAIVSALGVLMSIITALVSAVRKHGGTDADIYRLATPEGESLLEKIAELIVQASKPIEKLAENCYRIVVDYGQTLQQMIANGKYDRTNNDINASNFPPTQGNDKQNVVIELVHFGRVIESDAVLKEFEVRGLRAATLPELLAFGATYTEKQREFPVVALGSVRLVRGLHEVPYLCRWGAERKLSLSWLGDGWGGGCRFAAVRKY